MKKYTDEEIRAIVLAEEKRKERQRKVTRRQLAKGKILKRKALEMGITVTAEEIDMEMTKLA